MQAGVGLPLTTLHGGAALFSLQAFLPDGAPTPYVRASFSLASDADINTALERLSALLREQQQAK